MTDIHATNIIEDKLDVSYEEPEVWYDEGVKNVIPSEAVLLLTRCCPLNHEHINLNKGQAKVLAEWLVAFANGEYDE